MKPATTTFVRAGDEVRMKCQTDLNTSIHWQYGEIKSQVNVLVYDDGSIIGSTIGRDFKKKFSVQPFNGSYDLKINRAEFIDAGTYACIDNNNSLRTDEKAFVELVVIGMLLKIISYIIYR